MELTSFLQHCLALLGRGWAEDVGAEVVARDSAVARQFDCYAMPGRDLEPVGGPLGDKGGMDAKALSKRYLTPNGVYGMSDRGHARKLRLAKHVCQ